MTFKDLICITKFGTHITIVEYCAPKEKVITVTLPWYAAIDKVFDNDVLAADVCMVTVENGALYVEIAKAALAGEE